MFLQLNKHNEQLQLDHTHTQSALSSSSCSYASRHNKVHVYTYIKIQNHVCSVIGYNNVYCKKYRTLYTVVLLLYIKLYMRANIKSSKLLF